MKAARLHAYDPAVRGPEFLKLEEVADPKIRDADDVIVRIGGAGLCRTDLHIIEGIWRAKVGVGLPYIPCLLYTSPSPRDRQKSRMPSSA